MSQKQVLYDTHLLFKAKAENKKKLQKKAELIAIDKLKTQLNSTNENERTYASELLWSKWKISGGSRRLVERARDISLSTEMCLMHEISIAFQDSRMTQDNPIQCLQLRIEPVGTNMMDPLSSNIIHIP